MASRKHPGITLDDAAPTFARAADAFRAVSTPTWLASLSLLARADLASIDVARQAGSSYAAASACLENLHQAGLVRWLPKAGPRGSFAITDRGRAVLEFAESFA